MLAIVNKTCGINLIKFCSFFSRPNNAIQFQDALSIIFDRGAENPAGAVALSEAVPTSVSPTAADDAAQNDESSITYANMDVDESSNSIMAASSMDLDEQTQYQMLYGSIGDYSTAGAVGASVYGDVTGEVSAATSNSSADTNSPGEATEISRSVLGTVTEYPKSIAAVDKSIPLPNENTDEDIHQIDDDMDVGSVAIRSQELDDMAMLGIDVEDMAAQCF